MARPIKATDTNINVLQPYIFTVLPYNASVYEKRIIYRLVELAQHNIHEAEEGNSIQINPRTLYLQNTLFGEKQIGMYISDILSASGNEESIDKNYNRVKQAFMSLQEKKFKYEDNEVWISGTFIHEVVLLKKQGFVWFTISKFFWDLIGKFSKGFRKYELLTAMKLKSPYSMRFYELMSKQKTPLTYKVDDIRKMFDLGEKYDRPSNIIARIIKPAKEELDAVAPYSFEYKEERSGRGGKTSPIIGFTFFPVFHEENQDKAIFEIEKISKLTRTNLFGDRDIEIILRDSYGFENKEINKNKQNIKKAIDAMGKANFIDFLKTFKDSKRYKELEDDEKKKYLIGAIKKKPSDVAKNQESKPGESRKFVKPNQEIKPGDPIMITKPSKSKYKNKW